jgi:hypothetical protein
MSSVLQTNFARRGDSYVPSRCKEYTLFQYKENTAAHDLPFLRPDAFLTANFTA